MDGDLYIGAMGINVLMVIDSSIFDYLPEETHRSIAEDVIDANRRLAEGHVVTDTCKTMHSRIYSRIRGKVPSVTCFAKSDQNPKGHTIVITA